MPLPLIPIGLGLAGAAYLLFGGKKAKPSVAVKSAPQAKQAPAPRPAAPPVVFAPPAKDDGVPMVMTGLTPAQALAKAEEAVKRTGETQTFQTDPSAHSTVDPKTGVITMAELTMLGAPPGAGGVAFANQAEVTTKTDPLTVRETPSKTAKKMGTVAKGSIVDVTGPVVQGDGSQSKGWAPIKKGGLVGFASADFLDIA